jgi:hypothetical protein
MLAAQSNANANKSSEHAAASPKAAKTAETKAARENGARCSWLKSLSTAGTLPNQGLLLQLRRLRSWTGGEGGMAVARRLRNVLQMAMWRLLHARARGFGALGTVGAEGADDGYASAVEESIAVTSEERSELEGGG